MKAIIMAGGEGTRMLPFTKNIPKPLLKIAGKPMMEYVIDLLVAHGVKETGINLFYLGEQIENYFGNGEKYGVKIKYVYEKELTGTAGAVKAVSKVLKPKEPFFVISADMLINFDLTEIYNFHKQKGGIATIVCFWRPIERILGKGGAVVFNEKTKRITNFVERPQTPEECPSNWVNSSVYVLDPKILELIPDRIDNSKVVDIPKNVFPSLLQSNEELYAYPVDKEKFYQLGIDTPDRIQKAQKDIASGVFKPTKRINTPKTQN